MSEPRKCDVCKENRATVHLTQIIKSTFKRTHLCEACNQAQEPISPELLKSVLPEGLGIAEEAAELAGAVAIKVKGGKERGKAPTCSNCGLTFEEFKRFGRFGCAEDYAVFSESLDQILEKIHKKSVHVGRVPPNTDLTAAIEVRLRTLESDLQGAVKNEDYEAAAKLRDALRTLRGELHGAG